MAAPALTSNLKKNRKTTSSLLLLTALALSACGSDRLSTSRNQVYAPAVDPQGEAVDGLIVGHRLMEAGQYELALDAYTRAAGDQGLTAEVLTALGTANLQLGRLNQAEKLLRRASEEEPDWPEAWNNLGVVLMEAGKTAEATEIFRKSFALDNGDSAAIRNNLRLALQKLDEATYSPSTDTEFRLVRRGSGDFLIRQPDP